MTTAPTRRHAGSCLVLTAAVAAAACLRQRTGSHRMARACLAMIACCEKAIGFGVRARTHTADHGGLLVEKGGNRCSTVTETNEPHSTCRRPHARLVKPGACRSHKEKPPLCGEIRTRIGLSGAPVRKIAFVGINHPSSAEAQPGPRTNPAVGRPTIWNLLCWHPRLFATATPP